MTGEQEVLAAARTLEAAYVDGRMEDYFAGFAPGATFVFHTDASRHESLTAYREQWRREELEEGLAVISSVASNQLVQTVGDDVAILIHDVATDIRLAGAVQTLLERETIVFARQPGGRWLAVHEHLSPVPAA